MKNRFSLVTCMVLLSFLVACQGGSLRKNFYQHSCPQADNIIKNKTLQHVAANPNLPAKLLRMHFHDCFVRGCDASVLLNSTDNNTAEKDAIPNLTLAGFNVIDDIKNAVEAIYPKTVSCADILALAARDAVSVQFNKPMWEVLTGRRDGTVSKRSEALANIPAPTFNFTQLKQNFASKGLTLHDLVVLSGAHTIGTGHCNFFSNRLYNFTTKCKSLSDNTTRVAMDPGSSNNFDSHYYPNLLQKKGLFQSDAALLTQDQSTDIAEELVNNKNKFFTEFAQSMKRMGAIEVLVGSAGEIRIKCSVVNS
uniref:Peroxidase n=1 Tax=Cicer arietinum TaxID=3827 RepID=A0A076KWI6_CICAR|nr:peroxidase [Cicer arietinum]